MELKHARTTDLLLKAFYQVYGELGYGFLERVYEKSMMIATRELGLHVEQQVPIRVQFHGEVVGTYAADLIADSSVIVEIKSATALTEQHEAQLLNYLKATPFEVGLLINFGPRPEFKRRAYENSRKGSLSWVKKD